MPVIDEMITTPPPPAARRWGRPDLISSAAWPALSANVAVNSSGPALVRLPVPTVPPALATRWSRPPSSAAMASTARRSAGVSVTSAAAVATVTGPRSRSRRVAAAKPSASRAMRPTAAPSAASASATAKPMPRLPPVTSARLPLSPRSTGQSSSRGAAVVDAQPVLRRHPDHDLAAARVGGQEGVAALGAQVPAGELEPLGVGGVLARGRALDRDVLVGRPLILGAQAEPACRPDGARLAGVLAGAYVHGAAGLVGVPDRD